MKKLKFILIAILSLICIMAMGCEVGRTINSTSSSRQTSISQSNSIGQSSYSKDTVSSDLSQNQSSTSINSSSNTSGEVASYAISINQSIGGTISVVENKIEATAGEVLQLEYTLDYAYSFTCYVINGINQTENSFIMPNNEVEISAIFTYVGKTLTINYQGAGDNTPKQYTQTLVSGEEYNINSPLVEGYTASSLIVSGVCGENNVEETVNYTANTYNISYDYNGGVGGANPQKAVYDSVFSVSSPTKSGYKFAGWRVEGVNSGTAKYGSGGNVDTQILSEYSRCYQKNNDDLDYNGSAYWTANVYFKNLTSQNGANVTLKAQWLLPERLEKSNDAISIVNSENTSVKNSAIVELINGVKGDFNLSVTYYQNAGINQNTLVYSDNYLKTSILGIGKFCNWENGYYSYLYPSGATAIREGSSGIVKTVTTENYNAGNNYGDMFYAIDGVLSDSTKYATFVKNSLVSLDIVGTRVGQAGGDLKITQTITSYSTQYKNQSITIEYVVSFVNADLYNSGIDICLLADNSDISIDTLTYEILNNGYTYYSNNTTNYESLANAYSHYAPDKYWVGDFDFVVSYNQSQTNYYNDWNESCWRTGNIVFYEWQNVSENIQLRQDWFATLGENTNKISYVANALTEDIAQDFNNFNSLTTGKATTYGGGTTSEMRLFRNASVTVRCTRVGDTVTVYQYISSAGSSEITILNAYKFTTSIEKLSFQIVGIGSGITITYEDYSANVKELAKNSLKLGTYGLGSYSYVLANNRLHIAFPIKMQKGTTIKFIGDDNIYKWGVVRLSKYLGAHDNVDHVVERIQDSGWLVSGTRTYTLTEDSFVAINLAYDSNADMSSLNAFDTISSCLKVELVLPGNVNNNEQNFTTSMLRDNSTYGLTTYSGNFGEANTRSHVAIIPLVKKGTVITFTGDSTYRWSVLEMATEREVIYDTTWLNPSSVTSYTVSRDCYIAINVKYGNDGDMSGLDLYNFLYGIIQIQGKCGIVDWDNVATSSKTEIGDMQSVNHRGYSATAPENTIAAYAESKTQGFTKVECDINFTSDGYGVLLHDESIDRTSDGAGNIYDLNFVTVRGYDFGDWKNVKFDNEQIPTVEEFLIQCKNLSLHPYLELKTYNGKVTKSQIQRLALLVRRYGMEDNVTWISFDINCLIYVRDVSPEARLGYLSGSTDYVAVVNEANSLKTGRNEVFLDLYFGLIDTTDEANNWVNLARENSLPIEAWTVNDEATMKTVYNATGGYVTGFTSDNTIAENVQFT